MPGPKSLLRSACLWFWGSWRLSFPRRPRLRLAKDNYAVRSLKHSMIASIVVLAILLQEWLPFGPAMGCSASLARDNALVKSLFHPASLFYCSSSMGSTCAAAD